MVFYKYVSAKRIDILQNRLIRFTQPHVLNDPFEVQPYFDELKTKKGFAKAFAETISQTPPDIWKDIQTGAHTKLDQQAFAEKVENNPDYVEQLSYKVGMSSLLSDARDTADQLSKIVGILSLSYTPDNLLMWAHYAEGHTGFVLMLDGSHNFFKGSNISPGFAKPERVKYNSERPAIIFENETLLEIFFIKGSDWKYEQEWRYLKSLTDADEQFESINGLVNLFRLPPKCIIGVILGCSRSEELKNGILALQCDDPDFKHLKILQAHKSETHYCLDIVEIES